MKRFFPLAWILGLWVVCSSGADAHAFVEKAEPPVGGTVQVSPAVVKIRFTRGINSGACTLQVFDAKGVEVDRRDVHGDPADPGMGLISSTP